MKPYVVEMRTVPRGKYSSWLYVLINDGRMFRQDVSSTSSGLWQRVLGPPIEHLTFKAYRGAQHVDE